MNLLGPILKSNQYYIKINGKIGNRMEGIEDNTMWVHHKLRPENRCERDHKMIFSIYGMIPPNCMDCYKVCVAPKTLRELQLVMNVQVEGGFYSKCGCEMRDYISKPYGAYFYCRSKEEGIERLEEVKKLLPDFDIVLKRGCTEFEIQFGPSDKWKLEPNAKAVEEWLDENKDFQLPIEQPPFLKEYIIHNWLAFASIIGDYSMGEYKGQIRTEVIKESGRKLRSTMSPVTYG